MWFGSRACAMDLELGLNPMVILLGCLSDCPCFSTVSLGSWIVNCLPLNSAQICNVACWGPDFKAACQWFPSMRTRTDPGLSKPGSNPITQHVWTDWAQSGVGQLCSQDVTLQEALSMYKVPTVASTFPISFSINKRRVWCQNCHAHLTQTLRTCIFLRKCT